MDKVKQDTAAGDSGKRYASPTVRAVLVKAQRVLCLSGNELMREKDFGTGGFSEE